MLKNVNASAGGNYSCRVSTLAVSHTDTVVINISPYFVVEPQDIFVNQGKMVVINCQAEAFPSPTYQIFYQGTLETTMESLTLKVRKLSFGDYICNVTSGDTVITRTRTVHGKKIVIFVKHFTQIRVHVFIYGKKTHLNKN